MRLLFFLARRFVAGETLEEALDVVRDLNADGMHVALDLLGEYVRDREVALRARDAYIDLVHTLARERDERGLDANISIKLSMIGQKIDEAFCLDNLRHLLDVAADRDVFIRLDMEGSDTTASTLNLFETVYPHYPNHVGVVLQAYLKRTERDVERMCELNARVRICKGAYNEPAEIAYQNMDVIRERFLVYAQRLIEQARYPGIATHDDLLLSATRAFVEAQSIDRDRFEYQMLYGIRPETQKQIAQDGYRMRVYLPYGTEWMPYFSRRLRERKENVWFVLRHLFKS
ncbi:MAG: proline dehydrogenase family protein [Rhodothermales bacterium]